ncbi:MAG: hypothetical protein MZU95_16765 [Desulfomicrobium escambiense]|nr:hypothetical protein [Desulfomicrobium escambiense]
MTVAARTWAAGQDTLRGFLVLRTRTANDARRALVLRLRGRDPAEPEARAELPPGGDRGEAASRSGTESPRVGAAPRLHAAAARGAQRL